MARIQWPSELISDIARRRCVIFLGSGISRQSQNAGGLRPKTWRMFLEAAAEQCAPNRHIRSLILQKDYLTACEVIKVALRRDRFNGLILNEYLTPRFLHAPIHEEIFKLDSRIVATPNFDKIYETYANGEAGASIIVKNHYDEDVAEAIRNDNRMILKVHGTIDSPNKMIFTRKEYAEARSKYYNFYALLGALALTHTFLFLGCGVNDPDIKLILEDIFHRHPGPRPHYFILPRREIRKEVQDIIMDTMNIKILNYAARHDDHQELLLSIQDLVGMVDTEREKLRDNSNW